MNKSELFKEIETSTSDYIIVPKRILLKLLESSGSELEEILDDRTLKVLTPENQMKKLLSKLDPNSPTLPLDIKTIRKKLGLSQQEFAEAAGLKQPDLSDFENMKNRTFENYRKIKIIEAATRLAKAV